jgi:uncharacterized Zn finger protein
VQKLVLDGHIGEAIDVTYQLFPGILERNPNLLFALKVRQFIEMVANLNSAKSTDNTRSIEATSNENNNTAESNATRNGHSSYEEEMGKA